MKKFLFSAAAALLAFVGCVEQQPVETEALDNIELSSESAVFQEKGGKAKVLVTSSADWSLASAESYDWVTPSAAAGQDGDLVVFEVKENLDANKKATFNFKVGEASASFVIFSYAGEAPAIKVTSGDDLVASYEGAKLEIFLTSPVSHRDIKIATSKGAEEWLEYKATLPGDAANEAIANFVIKPLAGLADRKAEITISAEGVAPAVVKLEQLAKRVLNTDNARYKTELPGGQIAVKVETNVEYKIEIADEGKDWLKYDKKDGDKEIFTVPALKEGRRDTKVRFIQTNADKGKEPLQTEITITQTVCLVRWAADMSKSRLFPKWDGTVKPSSQYGEFTLETMFNAGDFDRADGGIFTVMGVEGKFLLRFGDVGNPVDHLQLALDGGNYNLNKKFLPNTWYHLAVTYNAGTIIVYVDGEPVSSTYKRNGEEKEYFDFPDKRGRTMVPVFPAWSYEPSGERTFWYGYSYNADRDFHGLMTEMRAWAKCLTKEEINAPDHFYSVPEDSEGLMTYWKFTEAKGGVIANKATNAGSALTGNSLYGETDIKEQAFGDGHINKGESGIKWVEINLPL